MLGRSKPAIDQAVVGNAELGEDVGARAAVCGRGQRQPRHVRMIVEQRLEHAIVGPEIVPPFADAMRFVDRDQREIHVAYQPPEALGRGAFRRDIEQVELARRNRSIVARGRCRRRSATRRDADRIGAPDLVVHQRDQRRDDQRRPVAGRAGSW